MLIPSMVWRNSLLVRLTATLILALSILLAVTAGIQISLQQRHAEECARINGLALTEVIYGAINVSMLAKDGHKELQRTVELIGHQSPNLQVRIYNKEGLTRVASNRLNLGQRLQKESAACSHCHRGKQPTTQLATKDRLRSLSVDGHRALGIVKPILNHPGCSSASCHAHKKTERKLGLLDVTLLLTPAEHSRQNTVALMIVAFGLAIILIAVVVIVVTRGAVRFPVRSLCEGVSQIGDGNYSARVEENDIVEFNRLGRAINRMAQDLERTNAQLLSWNQVLEHRVDEKTAELMRAHDQMIRIERMASLGKLAAVVAHEINNPLSSVVTYAKLLSRRITKGVELKGSSNDAPEILDAISAEAARCGDIVNNLLLFARRTGSHPEPTDANDAIQRALFLIKHKMDLAEVQSVLHLDPNLPMILCDPGQLEQALLALFVNAVEAMAKGGSLEIRSEATREEVVLTIADDGVGMSEEVCAHIFEPFYTTKSDEEGKGLGLGLSVVYGIVVRNGGKIEVESTPDQGTCFTITFNIAGPQRSADDGPLAVSESDSQEVDEEK